MLRTHRLALAVGVFVIVAATAERAWALPHFARKYKTSCSTCHEVFPRLSAVGEAFRLNGYKFADDELYIKEKPVELGADAYKRVWPRAIWPSDIPGLPPISLKMTSDFGIDVGGTKDARTEFNAPREVALLGAGALGEHMSAFIELGFVRSSGGLGHAHESTEETAEGEAETETEVQGWVQIEDIIGPENAVNLRFGTVGMHEMGLFTARDHNRVSINNYLYSSWTMPLVDGADMEGNPFIIHAQSGLEVNGFGPRWRYAVGVVNGNMTGFGDNNSQKDFYAQLAYKIGGLGFDGSGMEREEGLKDSAPWQDDSIILSLFAYRGTFPVKVDGSEDDDHFWRIGPGILCRRGDLQLGCGYIYGRNEQPFGALSSASVESHSWFVETTYFLYPWLIPYARYEALDLDLPSIHAEDEHGGHGGGIERGDRSRVVLGAKMLLRANVSLAVEARIYTENDVTDDTDDDDQIAISLEMAF